MYVNICVYSRVARSSLLTFMISQTYFVQHVNTSCSVEAIASYLYFINYVIFHRGTSVWTVYWSASVPLVRWLKRPWNCS